MIFSPERWFAEREQVKLYPRPKKCYFHSPLELFWLTMPSQIESSRRHQYTPLYEKQLFESRHKSMETTRGSALVHFTEFWMPFYMFLCPFWGLSSSPSLETPMLYPIINLFRVFISLSPNEHKNKIDFWLNLTILNARS